MSDQIQLKHLGIILDGNRRWAKAQSLPVVEGHKQGMEVFKEVSLAAFDRGIQYVSAFIFSTENWARTEEEVSYLMGLVSRAVEKHLDTFHKANIRLVHLGSRKGLNKKVLAAIDTSVAKTKNNKRGTLALCFNYGGYQEIADAASKALKTNKGGEEIKPENIEQNLYSPDIPPIDLLIRTSGEERISGFMLWRAAYAELMFTNTLWPDFTASELDSMLGQYKKRSRRFGT
jgi:undecaprenyl diphosphate synthase